MVAARTSRLQPQPPCLPVTSHCLPTLWCPRCIPHLALLPLTTIHTMGVGLYIPSTFHTHTPHPTHHTYTPLPDPDPAVALYLRTAAAWNGGSACWQTHMTRWWEPPRLPCHTCHLPALLLTPPYPSPHRHVAHPCPPSQPTPTPTPSLFCLVRYYFAACTCGFLPC